MGRDIASAIFTTLVVALTFSATTNAQPAAEIKRPPFLFVNIDTATEAKLGEFPIDRAHVAKAVDLLTNAGAKAVVLKFFYDLPSNARSDDALQKAEIGRAHV